MQRAAYEELEREIGLLLAYNPPALEANSESSCPKLLAPLSFYDKHLDERLTLKTAMILPSLTHDLSGHVDRTLRRVDKKDGHRLPPIHPLDDAFPTAERRESEMLHDPINDARSVAEFYQADTATSSGVFASMLILHPHAPQWSSILTFNRREITRFQRFYTLDEDFALTFKMDYDGTVKIPPLVMESMDDIIKEDIRQLAQRFPRLAVWQIFFVSQDAEDALKAMDRVASRPSFNHEKCHVLGYRIPEFSLPYTPDALATPLGIPAMTPVTSMRGAGPAPSKAQPRPLPRRRSSRLMSRTQPKLQYNASKKTPSRLIPSATLKPAVQDHRWTSITLPANSKPTSIDAAEHLAASLIQHAWSRAVQRDATFIIFHAGNVERIAFRHRSSQTLYISELINVAECSDPAYGKLHIGLYTSIIEDAIDRTHQQMERERNNDVKTRKKRTRDTLEPSELRKRPKTRAAVAREAALKLERERTYRAVVQESASRSLVIIQIRHAHYNSPAPASFLRVDAAGQDTYSPGEYFSLTITSEIASGATGDVHNATLEILTSTKDTLQLEVVVKLAFEPDQRKRMRHEFAIYKHLISSGVKGIPHIFGLFEDQENNALALVMSNVGLTVWDRRPDRKTWEFKISPSEGVAFMDVLKNIHRAGVRHRDLRPENLAVDDEGIVKIFDFDRAELNASEGSREREMKHLQALVNGLYIAPGDVPSLRTPDGRSRSGSASDNEVSSHPSSPLD